MKIQRNAPCPCGSNKKFKKCCLEKAENRLTLVIGSKESSSEEPTFFFNLFPEIEEACNALLKQLEADNDIAQFKKAVNILYQICPNSHTVNFLQGYACMREDKLEDAVPHLQKAIDLFPYFSAALCNLGLVYSQLDQIAESAHCLKQVIEIEEPENEIYQSAQTHLNALDDHYQQRLSLTLDEYLPVERLYNQARAYMKEEKYEDAAIFFRLVIALAPKYVQAHNNMGACYAALGLYSLTIECCENTLAIDPNNKLALYNRQLTLQLLEQGPTEKTKLRDFPDIEKDYENLLL